jgi:hypothetical protein
MEEEMSKVQVMRLSNRHEAILEYMVANPTVKLSEVAATFDVTQAWLSVLIHSDAFQEALRKKRDEVFHPAAMTLQEKLTGMAHLALDKLGEEIDNGKVSPALLLETGNSVLDRLGYGTKAAGGGGNQTNVFLGSVPAGVLQDARQTFGQKAQRVDEQREEEVVDAETDRTLPAKLEARRDSSEG